jgi:hypothetical protein
MKYIKTFESLKQLSKDQLDKLQDGQGEEDRLMIPTKEELEKYMILYYQHKFNL